MRASRRGIVLCALAIACAPACAAPADFTRNPILFVHGSGMDSRSWYGLIDYLQARGYPLEYLAAIDLRPPDGDNVSAATGPIAGTVEILLDRARRNGHGRNAKVDIVGLSMGAFSTRWYASQVAPERVRRWVGLAGANHGTDALCGRPGSGDRQMCPAFAQHAHRNAEQVKLNGTRSAPVDETPFGPAPDPAGVSSVAPDANRHIEWFTVSLPLDPWIVPGESAHLGGTGFARPLSLAQPGIREVAPGRFVVEGEASHDTLPDHAGVRALVAAILLAPDAK
jgi:pimeloyl-ACP methyl ester carboxylesterase